MSGCGAFRPDLQMRTVAWPVTKGLRRVMRARTVSSPTHEQNKGTKLLQAWAQTTSERLTRSAAEDKFSGAVLASVAGAPVLVGGYGAADRERALSNTADTRFRMGSLNKMFTATAAMALVQDGLIRLDTHVADVLPDYPNRGFAQTATLHHLLTHTSGLGDLWGAEFDAHRLELRDCADYVTLFGPHSPQAAPGSEWRYSSLGYIIVGRMLEVASGRDYDGVIRELVFEPARMNDTGSLPETTPVRDRAIGYMRVPGGWAPNTDTLPFRATPAGGGYSTVGDLDRFGAALMQHLLLDPAHTQRLLAPQARATEAMQYAYGFMVETISGALTVGHTGASRGMAAILRICPEGDWRVGVLSNRDAPAAGMVASSICEQIVAVTEVPEPTRNVALPEPT